MSDCKHTGSYEGWLDLIDEDKIWVAAIWEYKFQVARSVAAATDVERGDRLLWTLIQIGLSVRATPPNLVLRGLWREQ